MPRCAPIFERVDIADATEWEAWLADVAAPVGEAGSRDILN